MTRLPDPSKKHPRRPIGRGVLSATVALAACASISAAALAASTPTLSSTHNSSVNATIVINAHGRTLYALRPETPHHLLCKSSACLGAWPPLTVRSQHTHLVAGHGVEGKLGLLRRGSRWQVTLRGMPLYTFSGDSAAGEANGEGLNSFGGTWHTITAQAHPAAASAPAQPVPAPAPQTPAPAW